MSLIARRKSEQNVAILDPWTIVHFSTGLAFGLVRAPLAHSLAIAVAYEVVEQVVERRDVGQDFFHVSQPEAPLNALVDVAVFALGHALGSKWNRT